MKLIKAITALALASLALAAPSTQHRQRQYENSVGGYDAGSEGSTTRGGERPPIPGSGSLPIPGSGNLPIPGSGSRPIPGSGNLPIPGSGNLPIPGSGSLPIPGSGNLPIPGSGSLPIPGSGSLPILGGNNGGGIIPDGTNGNRGPFDGSTSYSTPRPSEYELDHTNTGLLGGSGLGNAVNALLNGVAAGTTGQIWYAPSLSFDPCR